MHFNVCILGAGPAGYSGALAAAREGMKVALVEKDRVGGTCLNRGCIPTKALRASASTLHAVQLAERFGVVLPGPPRFDYSLAGRHRDQTVETLVQGVLSLLQARRVAMFSGRGRLCGGGKVIVEEEEGTREISADHIIIATGSRPCDLPGIAIDEQTILSSEGALRLPTLPESLIVIGAGVIGCEFADLFASFGSRVFVAEALDRILMNEDRQTSRAVQKNLEARGVKFYLSATVEDVRAAEPGLQVLLSTGTELAAEKMIVSVGRRPAVEELGLSAAGVEVSKQAIKTDGRGRTSATGIYAAGDVIGPPLLAHTAAHEMEVVIDNLAGRPREFEREVIPSVVYVEPELASVGLLEDTAKQRGVAVKVGRFSYAASGKARCQGETEGFAKVIVSAEEGRILGATVMGVHAGELVHELALAIKAGLQVKEVIELIHAHPTLAEIVREAAADALGLAVHKIGRERPKTISGK